MIAVVVSLVPVALLLWGGWVVFRQGEEGAVEPRRATPAGDPWRHAATGSIVGPGGSAGCVADDVGGVGDWGDRSGSGGSDPGDGGSDSGSGCW